MSALVLVSRPCARAMFVNFLLLMFVTAIPFSTESLASYLHHGGREATWRQRSTGCRCLASRSVSLRCARGRPVAGCFTSPWGPPGGYFRAPFRCRVGRDLRRDRCGVLSAIAALAAHGRSPPTTASGARLPVPICERPPRQAPRACDSPGEAGREAPRASRRPMLTFAVLLVPALCHGASARHTAGSP